jgi:hypothetical protein
MPGVLVPPGESVIFTTLCETKGKVFVTHHIFLNRADTAICEKAFVDGCSVEKSDDLARLSRAILIAGKECSVLRLCSMLLDSYLGGRSRDTFRETVAIHSAKRFTAAEAAEDARRRREADATAASRTAAAKAADDARRKHEADEAAAREASANPRSSLVCDSVSASQVAVVKVAGDAGRKREAGARFVQKAAADAKAKQGTGATAKKKGIVAKGTQKATARRNRSANVAKKSTAASSKGKVSAGNKTRNSNRSMTVPRIRNRWR